MESTTIERVGQLEADEALDSLRVRALELAASHTIATERVRGPSPVDRLESLMSLLRQAYKYFVQIAEEDGVITTAAEWLLDNLYVIEQAGRIVSKDMPPGYYRRLPKLADSGLEGVPRIYDIARDVIRLSDGQVDLHRLTRFTHAYQELHPLTLGELWALPLMLRVVEIELLASAIRDSLADRLDEDLAPIDAVEIRGAPSTDVLVGRAVRGLRTLGTHDWETFVDEVSLVENILHQDPVGAYRLMEEDDRNRYRQSIEDLAWRSLESEVSIAGRVIDLAETAQEEQRPERECHVGYYLVDRGLDTTRAQIGYRATTQEKLRDWILDHAAGVYLSAIGLLTVLVMAGFVWYGAANGALTIQLIAIVIFALVPASIAAVSLVNIVVTHVIPPRVPPKLALREGIAPGMRTLVVIPCLLTDPDEVDSLVAQLERHYLSNLDPELGFALLSDLRDAAQKHLAGDDALVDRAVEGIRGLNRKYAENRPFYLFHREREWNPSEGVWMGWERKRGKLEQLNAWILGYINNPFSVCLGDVNFAQQTRYVITLDADTILPPGGAARLVGAMAHPLNRAVFDPDTGRVEAGYTILQPRTDLQFSSALASRFARIYGGDVGLDLYTRAVSDVYQDLFGEAIYVGKGIYAVEGFHRSLDGRVPENSLLSHDLFESLHGRAGLVSDIVVYEDYPPTYLAYTQRLHRWVRGDWQLLPWLGGRVPTASGERVPTRLSLLDRWKILDNLRRSTQQLALLIFLAAGWLILPGSPIAWTVWTLVISALPLLAGVLTSLMSRIRAPEITASTEILRTEAARWLLSLVFLPYEALILADAAITTINRVYISKRKLLQWTTAAHTARLLGRERHMSLVWERMSGGTILGLALFALTLALNPAALVVAIPLTLAWIVAPQVAAWISRPPTREEEETLTREEAALLRRLARRHWRFFEDFIGPEDHWLPPDHFQEEPLGQVAHRTSPTNIGLMLLSTVSAHQMGYIGPDELINRVRSCFESMNQLERYRGHWLNWYDTHSLEPLEPRYVSAVDSGNLAGNLIALRHALLHLPEQNVFRWGTWRGIGDVLGVLVEIVSDVQDPDAKGLINRLQHYVDEVYARVDEVREAPGRWPLLFDRLRSEYWPRLDTIIVELVDEHSDSMTTEHLEILYIWFQRMHGQLNNLQDELQSLMPWIWELREPPKVIAGDMPERVAAAWRDLRRTLPHRTPLGQIPETCQLGQEALSCLDDAIQAHYDAQDGGDPARQWVQRLSGQLDTARDRARWLINRSQDLAEACDTYVQEMEFGFLFDAHRQVFYIGYNVSAARRDSNHYDMMASEARLASLVAIAKGDVPASHWMHLERPLVETSGGRQALISWNGSMFEYLMPELVTRSYPGTLLHESNRAAVYRQIQYGRSKGVPWGISESGYYHFDAHQHYQYRGFGVPGLGRKRGLGDDLVIAPYATMLALPVAPLAVLRNIHALIEEGMLGAYGFYEAIDYTPGHVPAGQTSAIVKSFMVHHHGMTLVSLCNYLQRDYHVESLHADPRINSVEILLQEGMSDTAPIEAALAEPLTGVQPVATRPPADGWHLPVHSPVPHVHSLSNGEYTVIINNSGGGYSRWRDFRLTRWSPDVSLDQQGSFLYLRDLDSGDLWSATYQPTTDGTQNQEAQFDPHKAEFVRVHDGIRSQMEVSVLPDQDTEVRLVTLANLTNQPRRILLSSYGELVLNDAVDDERHPAFSKLFIQSEYLFAVGGQLFWRRLRASSEDPIYLLHYLLLESEEERDRLHEADRAVFVGRGRDLRRPAAILRGASGFEGNAGATLDPIMALGQVIELDPHTSTRLCWVTTAAPTRQEVLNIASELSDLPTVERAMENAYEQNRIELASLAVQGPELAEIQAVLSLLMYPHRVGRADEDMLARNEKGQSNLWPYAISGDHPIALVRVEGEDDLALVRRMLVAHEYWRRKGLLIDLVILNERGTSYAQESQSLIMRLVASRHSRAWVNRRGGIFILRADQMADADRTLLFSAARVILAGQENALRDIRAELNRWSSRLPVFEPRAASVAVAASNEPVSAPDELLFDNGLGGFTSDGREYVVRVKPGDTAPAPWSNVVANPQAGFLITEMGGGFTWYGNSGENRLTSWRNDPVSDTPAEALYLRDEQTGQVWSPTPLPAGVDTAFVVRHGAGYTIFEHNSYELSHELTLYVAPHAPVKIVRLKLYNRGTEPRQLSATYYAEWVLGTVRSITQQYILPEYDGNTESLLARNPYNPEYPKAYAFLSASRSPHSVTSDRVEFVGRNGSLRHPAGLGRSSLQSAVRPGDDPCAAIQVLMDLNPGESDEIVFLLGQAEDRDAALETVQEYRSIEACDQAWEDLSALWDDILGAVSVQTPEPSMDLLLNRWLMYQSLSSRIWGRSGLYQSSGAYGFRDQLQDVMSLMHTRPDLARDQILRAARHQFEEGDVLHWWHPPSGRGIRTRISDNLLWLPLVTTHYIEISGDMDILDEEMPFLKGDPLQDDEEDRYGQYESTEEVYSLFEHCRRAVERGATKGEHGLPLMGGGDWNDGMNRVGIRGEGESVWMGWFLYTILRRFSRLCDQRQEQELCKDYTERADQLLDAIEQAGWDGAWYRRAYYDDGTPLGSQENKECQIDSLSQSWAVLSRMFAGENLPEDNERIYQAMEAVDERLVREQDRLVLLFTPPFDKTPHDPGYIKGYLPGIRENGGQYTHAALWTIWAMAELGEGGRAEALYRMINPILRMDAPERLDVYQVEPYVISADVYGVPPHVGRGGWTWYTGSASWMYRLGLEGLLGLKREGNRLWFTPHLPDEWDTYQIVYRYGDATYRIAVTLGTDEAGITLDGQALDHGYIPLEDDGQEHDVQVHVMRDARKH